MRRSAYEWTRKVQLQLAVAMAVFPLHWLVAAWLDSSRIGTVWLFPAVAMAAGVLALRIPGKLRPVYGVCACLLLFLGIFLPSSAAGRWLWLLGAALSSLQIMWSLPLAANDGKKELPGYWISVGIASHVITQVLLLTDWTEGLPGWMLRLSFFCYVLLVMLSVNRQSLLDASGKRRSVPGGLRRRNMLLVMVIFGMSLIGAFLPSAVSALKDTIADVFRWIGAIIGKLFTRIESEAGNMTQQTSPELSPMGQGGGEMRQLPPIIETIILYIGAAISVAFLGMILYRIGKKLLRFARESLDLFGRFLSAASEDYVDEVTDIRDTGSVEQLSHRKRRHIRYKDDPSLPPSEQVRRRYRYLKHDHTDWGPGATAREKLPVQAASIYEKARYSERKISSEDAKAFIDMAKDI